MYTRQEIEDGCKQAFEQAAAGLDFPEIKEDSKIALDLEIDSIHILETMIIIEDNFNIALDTEEFQKATTIKDLYDLVEAKANA